MSTPVPPVQRPTTSPTPFWTAPTASCSPARRPSASPQSVPFTSSVRWVFQFFFGQFVASLLEPGRHCGFFAGLRSGTGLNADCDRFVAVCGRWRGRLRWPSTMTGCTVTSVASPLCRPTARTPPPLPLWKRPITAGRLPSSS